MCPHALRIDADHHVVYAGRRAYGLEAASEAFAGHLGAGICNVKDTYRCIIRIVAPGQSYPEGVLRAGIPPPAFRLGVGEGSTCGFPQGAPQEIGHKGVHPCRHTDGLAATGRLTDPDLSVMAILASNQ